MHTPPRIRGGLAARLTALLLGLFLFALAIVFQLESDLGLSPWDVLHQGIAEHTPLTFGTAHMTVSVVVLGISAALGAKLGIGTVANALLVGFFVVLMTLPDSVTSLSEHGLTVRVGFMAS